MVILLSDQQKQHLSLLSNQSSQVLIDFCKLVKDYFTNGCNHKKYIIAADILNLEKSIIQDVVLAMAHLISESCKKNLSRNDYELTLTMAGFNSEQQEILTKFYNTVQAELTKAIQVSLQTEPIYLDLSWRFEVQVASKSHEDLIMPIVLMQFTLCLPYKYNEKDCNLYNKNNNYFEAKLAISDAKTAVSCFNTVKHTFLQCDLKNLVHMTKKLEQALKESKNQYVRKIHKLCSKS